jgi:hypothetical protein
MPSVTLDAGDAAELAEMLSFLSQSLTRDPGRLAASLEDFVGNPAYSIQHLRNDLDRFVFLLGGSDGEHFLTGGHDERRPNDHRLADSVNTGQRCLNQVDRFRCCGLYRRASGGDPTA